MSYIRSLMYIVDLFLTPPSLPLSLSLERASGSVTNVHHGGGCGGAVDGATSVSLCPRA